MLIKFGLGVFY